MLRVSRFHPSMRRRIRFLGFEYYWWRGLDGSPRVLRRTARDKLKSLRHSLKEWIKLSRSKRLYQLRAELRVKMLGHYRYYTIVTELLFK